MGSLFSKKEEPFHDVTESKQKEEHNIQELVDYKYITPIEEEYIERIKKAKKDLNYENLVFSGGSVKAIAYIGALEILKNMNALSKVKRYAGTSAGAMIATLLAIGYRVDELEKIVNHVSFNKFLDVSNAIEGTINLFKDFGVAKGNFYLEFMKNQIERKTGNKNYTFGQLKKDTGIELVIVSTDLNANISMYFSHLTHPHMPIANAARMSMSIPLVFQPIEHNGSLFVDGGVLDNYPITSFDGKYPGDPQAVTNQLAPNQKTLGIRLITKEDINEPSMQKNKPKKAKIKNDKEFIEQLLNVLYEQGEKRFMRPSFEWRTIDIKTKDIPFGDFNVSPIVFNELICNGRESVRKFFEK